MGGEIAEAGLAGRAKRKIITGHLLWGTLLVFIGYFVATFADLVVEGPSNGATPYALASTVFTSLGQIPGFILIIFLISFFVFSSFTYTFTYSRLLLLAAID